MSATEAVSLAITIALGILSIGLGLFAIWFSYRLNESSASSLQAIRDLSSEIRALVQANLNQQEGFSAKMLDSILESGKYGKGQPPPPSESALIENTIRASLDEAEQRIADAVEVSLRRNLGKGKRDPTSLNRAIEEIRADIRRLSEVAPTLSASLSLPPTAEAALRRFQQFPAHYVVLAAIVRSGAKSEDELRAVAEEYNIPEGWEEGVQNLAEQGLLTRKNGTFEVPEAMKSPLAVWVDRNWQTLSALMASYRRKRAKEVHEEKRALAKRLEY
jgi:hypothetical protein